MRPAGVRLSAALFAALSMIAGPAEAETFAIATDSDLVGEQRNIASRYEDTLSEIARRFDLGYNQITMANPEVSPWLPGAGTNIVLPSEYILPAAPRRGIVLNLAEMRLYYYPFPESGQAPRVITHPIGVGRQGWETPKGTTEIAEKIVDPPWFPPDSVRAAHAERGHTLPDVVPPGPDNPLGHRAMRLGWRKYLIHGTNRPYGIGMPVSHGCIRLYPEDIESLFEQVVVGEPVHVVHQPYKAGWRNGTLYLQAYPLPSGKPQLTEVVRVVIAATQEMRGDVAVDWEAAMEIARHASGIPTPVLKQGKPLRPHALR